MNRLSTTYGNNPDLIHIRKTRAAFERLKQTVEFQQWKHDQFQVQQGLCAWCRRPIPRSLEKVHVDHAMPIFHGGTNKYDNLVLAHASCNMEKWIRVDATPQWIINRRPEAQLEMLRRRQKEIMLEDAYQRRLARWIASWVGE